MNLGGINSFGFQGLPKQSAKPSSEKGASSSFDEVLNQGDPSPDQKVEAEALPMQPTAPTLKAPLNDRMVTAKPVGEPALVEGGVKEKVLLPQEEGVDALTRRVVWNDFLRKMKDDLGVSAEDVLSAFASLSDEELAQPPQQTVDTVVAALGLNADQAQMAKGYFTELVAKTKSNSMGEELGKSQRQINLTLMSQREAQRKTLNRSLDQMNSNFFMKNQPTQTPGMPEQMPTRSVEPARPMPMGTPMEMIEVTAPAAATVPGMEVSAPPAQFPAEVAPAAQPVVQNFAKPKAEAKNTIDEMVRQFLAPQAKVETLKANEVSAAPAAMTAGAAKVDPMMTAPVAVSAGSLKGVLEDLKASLDGDDDSEYSSDASYLAAGLTGEHKAINVSGPSPEFQAELAKAAQEPMSVSNLVDKAQVMVHEGGGEMKVTLSPEGMGEVAMKVSVHEGKVQVQMITESDEAKKLIERQLGELKSSLHANDLKLDTIKIDTASNLGKQLEQQYQDSQRQATQTAWEQFRQDNQGWRRSFFETPSAKLYKGQGEAVRDVQAPSSSSASKKNINRRLDLVA